MNNPFSLITEVDCRKYAGQTIAVDLETGRILEFADSARVLREKMDKDHPNAKYARITLPLDTRLNSITQTGE